jgi:Tol biopolymer transport system component
MTLIAGARLGPYEIASLIGVGGMGEVYRARDTRLERNVAIKVLPEDFVDRPDRRRRFETEARAISSLHHPHICTLFDVGEQDGVAFLVMEYLEGETLDDRLARGPVPSRDMLAYATQIADALDHAHRERFIHRDLKPGNVILTPSGAKLLDFGLVRRTVSEPVGPESSSTLSFDQRKLTAEGALLGTLEYMAPEQLEGRDADARTDIFALGTLMFEMATGRKPFAGSSQASLIASILTHQAPPVSSVRSDAGLPMALDHIIERCLAKNPADRWQTARDVKLELEWIARAGSHATRAPSWLRRHRRAAMASVATAAAIAAASIGAMRLTGPQPPAEQVVTRFVVTPPPGTLISASENNTRIALSPDGRLLAFVATTGGQEQLWIHSMRDGAARPLEGTEGAVSPFWSPDSRFVGFVARDAGEIRKIEVSGGPARTVCAARVEGAPTWGRDGTILFTQFLDGIFRVPGEGGTPVRVTTIDKAGGELNHYWPNFLPDGRRFTYLVTALDANGIRVTPSVYVASLTSPEKTLLARLHSKMVYAPPGHLLFAEQGTLLARTFDAATLSLSGEPVRIAEALHYYRTVGHGAFSASENGVLAYQGVADDSRLVWYDGAGNSTDAGWGGQRYGTVRFSPDGQRVAVDVTDSRTGTADIWIYDVSRGAPIRVTSDPIDESEPVWSPDGGRLMFRMNRGRPAAGTGSAAPNLFARTVGNTAGEELMVAHPGPLNPEDWSRNGRWIAYISNTVNARADLLIMALDGDRKPRSLAATRFMECCARFSPDSSHVAFVSDESGAEEVYVATVPESAGKTRISIGGGTSPRWARGGRTLFYVAADRRSIMRVAIDWTSTIKVTPPVRVFTMAQPAAWSIRGVMYDVTPDGERFLVNVPAGPPESKILIVQNWTAGLTP